MLFINKLLSQVKEIIFIEYVVQFFIQSFKNFYIYIYIYIYTTSQNYLATLKISFLVLKVYHNSFIYYTERTRMLWVIILHENKSLTHKPRSRGDQERLQYAVIVRLIQFAPHLVQIPDFAMSNPSHTITESPQFFTVDVIQAGCSSFTNSSLHIKPSVWPKDFEFWFVSPKYFNSTPLLSNPCAPRSTGAFRHCFASLNNAFLTAFLPYKPVLQSCLFTGDVDIFFSRDWFSCAVMFGAVSLLSHKLVTLIKLISS